MAKIDPDSYEAKIASPLRLQCMFCGSPLEFHVNESMSDKGIVFDCLKCQRRFRITRIDDFHKQPRSEVVSPPATVDPGVEPEH